jgi:type VI secretion system protein ImpF
MAQLSLRERLQPALFDRLIDDERLLTCYEFTFRRAELATLRVSASDLQAILTAQGLRAMDGALVPGELRARGRNPVGLPASESPSTDELFVVTLVAPGGRVSLSQLKSLVLKPPGKPLGVALQSFCEIISRSVINQGVESGELRSLSMRRLRDYVCRDLAALLNCASLDAVTDLAPYPYVQRSVLNFGMPSLAGRMARAVDPQQIAATIEAAVRRFEPRLSDLRVSAEMGEEGTETHVLAFRIEAQLWGHPTPQHLVLRTSIDVDTGDVSLADSGVS